MGRSSGAVHAVQAGVVVVALQAVELEAAGQRFCQRRQLVRDELVGQRVGFCRDAHGNVVSLGKERHGKQVGERLADAGTRLDGAVGRGRERAGYLARHLFLLGPALEVVVHPARNAVGRELSGHFLTAGRMHRAVELLRVLAHMALLRRDDLRANGGQREAHSLVRKRKARQYGAECPVDLLVHSRQIPQKTRGQVGEGAKDDSPHAAERVDVVARVVRDRRAPECRRHIRQPVGRKARERDARERKSVDPNVGDVRPSRDRLHKGPVEGHVVGEHRGAADELGERGHGLLGRGCTGDVDLRDAGELLNLGRNRAARIHEGLEPLDDLAPAQAGRAYLD